MIKEIVIIAELLTMLANGNLNEDRLLQYFENNKDILKSNIEYAFTKYEKKKLDEIVGDLYPKYLEDQSLILSNYKRFSVVKNRVIEKIESHYDKYPEIYLVPCIGLFTHGGWTERIDDKQYILLAMERITEDMNMDIFLTHEIAHCLSEENWNTVLDGFYREGYATYVSLVLSPGHNDETYLYMDEELYMSCLNWIDKNRGRIYEESSKKLEVLNEYHKFYFTTGYNKEYPNIGYVIGCEYLKYLNKKYTLNELRTFGKKVYENEKEFKEFIFQWSHP